MLCYKKYCNNKNESYLMPPQNLENRTPSVIVMLKYSFSACKIIIIFPMISANFIAIG